MTTQHDNAPSEFDWRIYADATCAGLSVLIPIPLVDLVFETIFRRRIPSTIAKLRNIEISSEVQRQLGKSIGDSLSMQGCLKVAFAAVKYVLRRIWRKIIYIFAVKDATTALAEYWHRAFLIHHMVRAGHLAPTADTNLATTVFSGVMRVIDPSPLMGLAQQTVANTGHVFRLLIRARRLGAAEVTRSLGEMLSSQSEGAESSLRQTARLYNQRYAEEVAARDSSTMADR